MGLLDGKTALIFGVANDHSIAWGIARALHAEGAEVGFSSVESLIEKRVRPLAESLGSTFVEPCDVQRDEDIERVFARWREGHDRARWHEPTFYTAGDTGYLDYPSIAAKGTTS